MISVTIYIQMDSRLLIKGYDVTSSVIVSGDCHQIRILRSKLSRTNGCEGVGEYDKLSNVYDIMFQK